MSGTITAKRVLTHPLFSMICVLALFFFIWPRYGNMAAMIFCAGILSAYVAVLPDYFRSRRGSLIPAICLVAAGWLIAAVTTAMTLMGEIQN